MEATIEMKKVVMASGYPMPVSNSFITAIKTETDGLSFHRDTNDLRTRRMSSMPEKPLQPVTELEGSSDQQMGSDCTALHR